jgi:hypothetical protein
MTCRHRRTPVSLGRHRGARRADRRPLPHPRVIDADSIHSEPRLGFLVVRILREITSALFRWCPRQWCPGSGAPGSGGGDNSGGDTVEETVEETQWRRQWRRHSGGDRIRTCDTGFRRAAADVRLDVCALGGAVAAGC